MVVKWHTWACPRSCPSGIRTAKRVLNFGRKLFKRSGFPLGPLNVVAKVTEPLWRVAVRLIKPLKKTGILHFTQTALR